MKIATINKEEIYTELSKISKHETDIKLIIIKLSKSVGLSESDIISILISNEIELSRAYSVTS